MKDLIKYYIFLYIYYLYIIDIYSYGYRSISGFELRSIRELLRIFRRVRNYEGNVIDVLDYLRVESRGKSVNEERWVRLRVILRSILKVNRI